MSHSYSILGTIELVALLGDTFDFASAYEEGMDHTIKLVRVRNPWGKTENRGLW